MNAIGGAAIFGTGMGLAGAHDNQSVQENAFKSTQQTKLSPMTGEELDLSNAATSLGLDQSMAVRRLLGGSFALSPQEMEQLNQMYAPSEMALRVFGGQLAQDYMGRSGLSGTSTPVTNAVMQQMLPAMAQLQQQKMGTGLGLGMQMRGLNLQAAQSMPGSVGFQLQKLFNERLATGRTTTQGSTRGTFNPGFLDRLATASGAQKNFTSAGKDLMSGSGGDMAAFGMSDIRLKKELAPVSWKWKHGTDREYLGVIAQEVEQSHPHLVARDADGHMRVDYGTMVAMLLDERRHLYAQLDAVKG